MNPEEMVAEVSTLVSLPLVCVRVNEMLADPHSTAASLGELISHDPSLTTRLLKLVNSAYYGLAREISTVSHAVAIVGTAELRSLVLATSAVRAFRGIPTDLVDMDSFWHHSVYCGLAARILAGRMGWKNRETLFVAGLLHDVGQLVLYHQAPREAREVLERRESGSGALHELEQEVFGFTHADVGAALLRAWNLPQLLWEAVKYHHRAGAAGLHAREAAAVSVANALAARVEPGTKAGGAATPPATTGVPSAAWALLGLPEESAGEIVGEANLQSFEVLAIIAPDATLIY